MCHIFLKGIGNFTEMSSFPETKVEKWLGRSFYKFLLKYHELQLSRVYPKGGRIDSSNYDPMRMWNCGCQMVALNYQTPDRPMQLHQAKFMQNGSAGYVLRPEFMFSEVYNPYERTSLANVEPITLHIRVIGARHLMKPKKGIVSPYVEIEVVGTDFDTEKSKTGTIQENGFNPVVDETFNFCVHNPDLSLLRFVVQTEDMFGDPNFLGQATFPLKCIRTGFRSVPLRNEYSEELELAALLIYINFSNARDEEAMHQTIQNLRDRTRELNLQIESLERSGDQPAAQRLRTQLASVEDQIRRENENMSHRFWNGF